MTNGVIPRRPSGTSPEAIFAKAVHDRVFSPDRQRVGHFIRPEPSRAFHPFKIYGCADDPTTANDWRKFRVAAGYVSSDWAAPVLVTGTDGDASPVSILADDATEKFWFWIDLTTPATPSVGSGADPQTWSASKIPIGYVNTTEEFSATVDLQMITTNLFACPT